VNLLEKTAATLRARPYIVDTALALAVYLTALLVPVRGTHPRLEVPDASTLVLGALMCGALVFRRRSPRAVLALCVAGTAAFAVMGAGRGALDMAVMVAVYTVATRSSRRAAWIAAALAAGVLSGVHALSGDGWLDPLVLSQLAWTGMAAAIGDAVRSRRAYVAAVEERARRAEETREEEAERRVMEERLRIARELHDVLAHHIALINVQAQVAEHVLDRDPGQARQALGHVRRAGKEALGELRTTVGLLRSPDNQEELPTEPSPGLERLPDLVASFTAAGLRVGFLLDDIAAPLPAPVELAAFRIVQEALTNISKHAPGAAARVHVALTPSGLRVEATDDGPGGLDPGGLDAGTGHGLIGMRERALSLGGHFAAGPMAGGGFRVRAVLPLTPGGSS
jgi:signal transduction histidine kinase